ncbi:MAG TPA: ferredoxin, partial [Myxococcota bacterium]|nr:ferredoxin [Myxococcota bacterium]
GAAFAMMQLKAIFSVLLRRYEFSLAQPPETYRNDHSKMVVQLASPCRVRYRRRAEVAAPAPIRVTSGEGGTRAAVPGLRIRVDRDLCQGHAVCMTEAPELFRVAKSGELTVLSETVAPDLRAKAEAAVRHCPTRALALVED